MGERLAAKIQSPAAGSRHRCGDSDSGHGAHGRQLARAALGIADARGLGQEPLHRPHVHHARPERTREIGAAQAESGAARIPQQERPAGGRLHRPRHDVQADRPDGARGGRTKVYFASAAPPVRFPNVYGIDMPAPAELVAHDRTEEEVQPLIGADWLVYQDLDDLIAAVADGNEELTPLRHVVLLRRVRDGRRDQPTCAISNSIAPMRPRLAERGLSVASMGRADPRSPISGGKIFTP